MFTFREEGFETPVKDQGECASSWAYAAVAVLEGQYFRATGESVSFSEQSLIDAHSKKQGRMKNYRFFIRSVQIPKNL